MRIWLALRTVLCVLLLTSTMACGQKGPLYLPETASTPQPTDTPA